MVRLVPYTGEIQCCTVCLGVHEQLDWSHIQVIYRAAQSVYVFMNGQTGPIYR